MTTGRVAALLAELRSAGQLVLLEVPIVEQCPICGCSFMAPGEVVLAPIGIVHLPCLMDEAGTTAERS